MRNVSVALRSAVGLGLVTLLACSMNTNGIGPMVTGDDARLPDAPGSDGPGTGGSIILPGTGGQNGAGGSVGTGGSVVPGTGGVSAGTGGVAAGTGGSPGTGGRDAGSDVPVVVDMAPSGLGTGALCSAGSWCASGFCVDGVCCETACSGSCMACSAEKTAGVDGQCRAVKLGSDPDSECAEDAAACGRTGRCANGACEVAASGKICGEATCQGALFAPAPRCNGAGTCVTQPQDECPGMLKCASGKACAAACKTDNDCTQGTICDTTDGTCKTGIAVGMACNPAMNGADCESGHCVDGVCCDAACTGTCRACTQAKTGQRTGHCAPVKVNTDPDEECATDDPATCGKTGACDGAGACRRYPDGTTCGTTCCSTNSGQGGGVRPCNYVCRAGMCDTGAPLPAQDSCNGISCCCPNGGGAGKAACVFPGTCSVQCLR